MTKNSKVEFRSQILDGPWTRIRRQLYLFFIHSLSKALLQRSLGRFSFFSISNAKYQEIMFQDMKSIQIPYDTQIPKQENWAIHRLAQERSVKLH